MALYRWPKFRQLRHSWYVLLPQALETCAYDHDQRLNISFISTWVIARSCCSKPNDVHKRFLKCDEGFPIRSWILDSILDLGARSLGVLMVMDALS